jgi:hypothetical protein
MSNHQPISDFPLASLPNSESHLHTILHQPNESDVIPSDVIPTEDTPDQSVQSSWFSKLLNGFITLLCAPSYEPVIWQKRDRNGNSYWECYDPVSDRTLWFSCEDEARIWLDQPSYIPWHPPY